MVIVDIIGSIDDKIESNTKLIFKMNQYISLVFEKIFGEQMALYENSTELFPHWELCKISDVSEKIITGKTPPTSQEKYWGNDINFITIPDMKSTFISKTERYISNICRKEFKNYLLPAYSLIISCIATVGLVGINTNLALTNQQINSITFIEKNDVYFYYVYFKKIKHKLINLGVGGSATLNINKTTFSNILFLNPPQELKREFFKKAITKFEIIERLELENQNLEKLKSFYLSKFFK